MAIEKYTTHGLIVASYEQGEHDRVYKIFTKEFGMLLCKATSIRKNESKLRAHMKVRKYTQVTLVKGKEVWRLVGGEEVHLSSPYLPLITLLLTRFIRGEGVHLFLYERLLKFIVSSDSFDKQNASLLLYYLILLDLGYADSSVLSLRSKEDVDALSIEQVYTYILLYKDKAKQHIASILQESHL